MGLFSSKPLPPTPEEQYARRMAPARAEAARDAWHAHAGEAERAQMGVDVYGREGRWYSDPERAAADARTRDHHAKVAAGHRAEYERQERLLPEPQQPDCSRRVRRFLGL